MKAAAIYFAVRVFAALVGIAAIAIYTRVVSPEGFGIFMLVISAVTTIFALAYQWLRAGILRFLPREDAFDGETVAAALKGWMVISLSLVAIAVTTALFAQQFVAPDLVLIAVACAVALSALELTLCVAQSRRQPILYAALTACRAIGAILVGGLLAWYGLSAMGLLIGYFVAHALPAIIVIWQVRDRLFALSVSNAKLAKLANFGWPMAIIGIGGAVIGVSDRYMIAWLASTAEAGIYAAPYDLAQRTLNMLMLAAFLAYSPEIFRTFDRNETKQANDGLGAQARLMLVVGLPTALALALFAPLISNLLFGAEFREGATRLIPWIAAAALIQGWNSYYLAYGYTITEKVRINSIVVSAGAAINLALNFWLIPKYGAMGAAYATLATYILLFATSLIITRRWIALVWPTFDLVKLVLLSIVAALICWPINSVDPALTAWLLAGLAMTLYMGAILALDIGAIRTELIGLIRRREVAAA